MTQALIDSTGNRVLAEIEKLGVKVKEGKPGSYRGNSPLRANSDSNCFALEIESDGEGGKYYDHVTDEGGSLYQLAKLLGVEIPKQEEITYDYHDEAGTLILQVVRKPGKNFLQRRPKGNGWAWSVKGINRPPYHLPKIAKNPEGTIHIVEGEKDADRLQAAGLIATTNAGGAGNWSNVHSSYYKYFQDRRIVIIPDNDKPGHKHALEVANRLHRWAASIKVLPPLGEAKGYDVSDWLADGGDTNKLRDRVKAAPEWEPAFKDSSTWQEEAQNNGSDMVITAEGFRESDSIKLKTAREILATEYDPPVYVVETILAEGLTILGGPMKIGKSLLLMQLSSAVSTGGQVLSYKAKQGRVLFLDLEGSEPEFQQRMERQNWPADGAENVDVMHARQFFDKIGALTGEGLKRFEELVASEGYILVIVDTLAIATMADDRADVYDNKGYTSTVKVLRALNQIAQDYHCNILVTGHHSKAMIRGTYEPNPFVDVLGNVGLGGTVHTAWGLYKVAGQTERKLIVGSRGFYDAETVEIGVKIDGLTSTWIKVGDWDLLTKTDRERKILDALDTWGDLSITGLATHTDIAKPHVSNIVSKLLADNMVTTNKQGRQKIVSLPREEDEI